MIYKFCLTAAICAFLCASCSKIGRTRTDEIVFDDKPKTAAKGEVVIDDKSFEGEPETNSASEADSREAIKVVNAQSQTDTSFDGFGNKTDARCFEHHPRLQCVLLRTAADGKQQTFVYGQNGQIKHLPENMTAKALTASADEIANAAGIYQTYRQPAPVEQNFQTINAVPLQPLPSYNFPVRNRQAEPSAPEENNSTANTADEKPPENADKSSTKQPGSDQ